MSAPASPSTAALTDAGGGAEMAGRLRADRLFIALAYTIAWGAMLVNRGLYWDDWTLRGLPGADLIRGSWELGLPWIGYFYAGLYATPLPGLIGHLLVFVAYLGSSLLLHAILLHVPRIGRTDALVAGATFAVLPVNYARIALIDLTYALSLLAFLAASWLLIRYAEVGGPARRLAALALFICSFSTASLLVLYIVPVVVAALILRRSARMSPGAAVIRHADVLLLPVAYWILKTLFLKPSGVYEGYNALSATGIAKVPGLLPAIPYDVLVEPLYRAVMVGGIVGLAAGAVVVLVLLRRRTDVAERRLVSAPVLAIVGIAIVALGVFPYLAVSRIPSLWDWSSRHQLLVPIGIGLIAAALARGVPALGSPGRALGIVVVGGLLGISIVADARTLKAYQGDWFKQAALIEAARTVPAIGDASHIRVVDEARGLDAMRRTYRFYEYNALLVEALGDTRRLASTERNEPSATDLAQFIARPQYHMSEYVPGPVDLELRLSAPRGVPGLSEVVRLVVLEATDERAFRDEVSRLIDVNATPVTPVAAATDRGGDSD